FNIPFGETQAGKGEITFEDPRNMGGVGVCGSSAANKIAKNADVVIHLGTKLNDFVTCSKTSLKDDVKVVSINVKTMDAIKYDAESMIADAKEGLLALGEALRKAGYKSAYGQEYIQEKQAWLVELECLAKMEKPEGLCQTAVILALNKAMDGSDIIVAASGSMPSDLERLWSTPQPGGYHMEYGFSCMGYEVGAALGIKIAEPDNEVYALFGDGVFFMSHSEFITSLQERKKINLIVFDNHGHQCIHNLQRSQGVDSFATELRYREDSTKCLSGEYVPISFAKIAEGYGAKSYCCTSMEQVISSLEDSKKQTASTLIEIKVLPGTMTESYEAFWRVGVATTAENENVEKAATFMQ
ncbi:MAG: thiamine pyrophosphate-dependent enzyme, partial [Saezia sp.]